MRKLKLSFPIAADKQYFLMFIFNKDGLKMESFSCEDQRRVIGAFSFQNVVGKDPCAGCTFSIAKIYNKDRPAKVVRDHIWEKVACFSIKLTVVLVLTQKFCEFLPGVSLALCTSIFRGCYGQDMIELSVSHRWDSLDKIRYNKSS